jgi:hypothetical protein
MEQHGVEPADLTVDVSGHTRQRIYRRLTLRGRAVDNGIPDRSSPIPEPIPEPIPDLGKFAEAIMVAPVRR